MAGSAGFKAKAVADKGYGRSSVAPRQAGANADGAATVRNVLPWRNMEKELAQRLAAKAARSEVPPWKRARHNQDEQDLPGGVAEAAPDSGVRSSVTDEPMRPLTYSMYTVSELDEARPYQPPPTPIVLAPPSPWPDVGRSALALARVVWSWVRTKKPRPNLIELCRDPIALFAAHLRAGLKSLPWKKIGWGSAIAFGSFVVLLFAIIALAELTDDVPHNGSTSSKSMMIAKAPAPVETAGRAAAAPPPDPANNAIELDDEPAPAKARPTPKPKSKAKKPKPPDLFNP